MRKLLIALASGLIFGFGLIVSAMIAPSKVLAFLDVAVAVTDHRTLEQNNNVKGVTERYCQR